MESETRGYLIGPFTLEEWLYKSDEYTSMFQIFAKNNPELSVRLETIVDDYPDVYFILVKIERFN